MRLRLLTVFAAVAALQGCVAPTGPVEVTRFYVADTATLGRGTISLEPGPDTDAATAEYRTYSIAVGRELARIGYGEPAGGRGDQVASIAISRQRIDPQSRGGPVSVGLGGGSGSYGSGVGVGIGIDLSGRPPARIVTQLAVRIRQTATGQTLWEGRAQFAVSEKSPMAENALGASRMAQALFRDFPGKSGETIEVP